MSVAVVVPLALDCPYRARAWEWVRHRWATEHPDWEIVTGTCEGPWSKGTAVADAVARTDADVLVVADADVWVDKIGVYVSEVTERAARFIRPHRRVFRLNEQATEKVYAGEVPADVVGRLNGLAQSPYSGVLGGGMVILHRRLYEECPIDPRFVGWGGEDEAWGFALSTMAGRRTQGREALWHLWHPPPERRSRRYGSVANEYLRSQYQHAAGDVTATRQLIDGGAAWRSKISS